MRLDACLTGVVDRCPIRSALVAVLVQIALEVGAGQFVSQHVELGATPFAPTSNQELEALALGNGRKMPENGCGNS